MAVYENKLACHVGVLPFAGGGGLKIKNASVAQQVYYAQKQAFTMGSTWSKTRATKDPEGTTRVLNTDQVMFLLLFVFGENPS